MAPSTRASGGSSHSLRSFLSLPLSRAHAHATEPVAKAGSKELVVRCMQQGGDPTQLNKQNQSPADVAANDQLRIYLEQRTRPQPPTLSHKGTPWYAE
jgi:hypothetical protein